MKKNIGVVNALFPTLDVIVGTEVKGKVNFANVAYVGIIDHNTISVSIGHKKYSAIGIKENKTFSVNLMSEELMVKGDYVGIVSGHKVDKSRVFENFIGTLKKAPMIKKSPISMECKLVKTIESATHTVFIGKIAATYCNENVLTPDNKIDLRKAAPLFYGRSEGKSFYFTPGEIKGICYSIGKTYKKGE